MCSTPIITGLMLVGPPVGVLGLATLMLWLSGNWRWVEGWIFGGWWLCFMAAMVLWLHYKDPALLAERLRTRQWGEIAHRYGYPHRVESLLHGFDRCAGAGYALRLDTASTSVERSMRRHPAPRRQFLHASRVRR